MGAFAASSIFTVVYLHGNREDMDVNQRRLQLQAAVELATRSLETFSQDRPATSRVAASSGMSLARAHLDEARALVNQALAGPLREDHRLAFKSYGQDLADLEARL